VPVPPCPTVKIDRATAEFMHGGVAIDMAAQDRRHIPRVGLALACRVADNGERVTLLAAEHMNRRFLDALGASRVIAAVFCLASTHRAMQVKGVDVQVEQGGPVECALVETVIEKVLADWLPLGFSKQMCMVHLDYQPDQLLAISFRPTALFQQTPGPNAGKPVVEGL
jgi:hypothetical protein